MRIMLSLALLAGLLCPPLGRSAPLPKKTEEKPESNYEKLRKELNIAVTLELNNRPFSQAINELKKQTNVNLVIDRGTVWNYFINWMGGQSDPIINLKAKQKPLKEVLADILRPMELTYVLIEDKIFITTEGAALYRQVNQKIDVKYEDRPLAEVVEDLKARTGVKLMIDPKLKEEAQSRITLDIEDVTVDTILRLAGEMADLSAAPIGKVIFLTKSDKALRLRQQASIVPRPDGLAPLGQDPWGGWGPGGMPPGAGPGFFPGGAPGGGFPGGIGGAPGIELAPPGGPEDAPAPPPLDKPDDDD